MKRVLIGAMLLPLLLLGQGCGGKREAEPEERPVFNFDSCPVSRIEVVPQRSDDPGTIIGSGREVLLEATALDRSGRPIAAGLSWGFRYPDADDEMVAGAGHRLEVIDESRALFKAGGVAPGTFIVVVRDKSCNLVNDDQPQYAEGLAWIRVYDPPGAAAACGRMRVTYGDDLDRMGDEVIASSKVTLIAEVSGPQKLPWRYKVRFYINDKRYPGWRPLYRDLGVPAAPGMSIGHKALLPIYLVPGEFRIRYELVEKGRVVCGSRTERFTAR